MSGKNEVEREKKCHCLPSHSSKIPFLFFYTQAKNNNFKVNVKAEQKVSACYQSIIFDVNISSYSVQSIASESS